MTESDRRVLIFAKSLDQDVKTRLAATTGSAEATELYDQLVTRTLRAVDEVASPAFLLVAGDVDHASVQSWLGRHPRLRVAQQAGSDLGQRMSDAFDRFAPEGGVLMGTDCPDLSADVIDRALSALGSADVVLVPAEDGGYVLIGLRKPCVAVFEGVPWSTSVVAARTVAKALRHGLSVVLLPTLWDVDDEAGYERWLAREID